MLLPILCVLTFQPGIQYLMFTTFPSKFFPSRQSLFLTYVRCLALFGSTYGFSSGISGLAYIGLGVGFCASAAFGARWANNNYRMVRNLYYFESDTHPTLTFPQLSERHGKQKPEFRLPGLVVGALMVPIGLFWSVPRYNPPVVD